MIHVCTITTHSVEFHKWGVGRIKYTQLFPRNPHLKKLINVYTIINYYIKDKIDTFKVILLLTLKIYHFLRLIKTKNKSYKRELKKYAIMFIEYIITSIDV